MTVFLNPKMIESAELSKEKDHYKLKLMTPVYQIDSDDYQHFNSYFFRYPTAAAAIEACEKLGLLNIEYKKEAVEIAEIAKHGFYCLQYDKNPQGEMCKNQCENCKEYGI